DATLTRTGALVGTPMYMSPEQVTGRLKLDRRTDIYSLGLVLYELLTLRRPISATTREDILRAIATNALTPASWHNRAIGADLEGVIHKATARDPDQRYASAVEMATDLQYWLDGKPVSANRYRYFFDRREIVLRRPAYIMVPALLLFFISFSSFLGPFGQ